MHLKEQLSAELTLRMLECLSFDLPANREAFLSDLRPGQRVRLYPTGDVFEIGGVTDGSAGMRIAFGPDGASAPPHLLRLLVSTVLATDERSPICIVLPSVERVAAVISILVAAQGGARAFRRPRRVDETAIRWLSNPALKGSPPPNPITASKDAVFRLPP